MPDTAHRFGLADALLVLMAAIWGANYTAVKYAGRAFSPVSFTVLRVALAMVTLMTAALAQRRSWPSARDVWRLLALGVLGNGVYQLLFVAGVARTRVGDAALILAAAPAFMGIISWVRGVERVGRRAVGGIVLSIAGVGVVMYGSSARMQHAGSLLGAALLFVGVICWSTFSVLLKPFTERVDDVQLNALTVAGGVLPLLFFLPHVVHSTPWGRVNATAWGALAYSAIISVGVAYLFWYRGIRVLGPTRAAMYSNLQPVVASLVGWLLLGEAPTGWQGIGAVAILGGIVLART